jgi:Double zinc ribbon
MVFAYFGIESSGLSLVIDLLILFVVVLYFALIYWTYADARRRIFDPMLVGCATAASLFPFVGTIVYMILRPPEYLEDVRERELEMQAAEARLHDLDHGLCPHCDYRVERDFVRCPSCLRKLKERCVSCSRPLDQAWTICPYCETEVPGAGSSRRTRRRRAPAESERSEIGQPAIESERSGAHSPESWLEQTDDDGGLTLAGDGEDVRAAATKPVAASEPVTRPRSAGRPGGRPRSTS